MHEITDTAIVLAARAQGENHAVADVLTAAHGRIVGFVFGGQGRRQQPKLQIGNRVECHYVMKQPGQIGTLTLELQHNPSASGVGASQLSALQFIMPLLSRALPEQMPYPRLHHAVSAWLDALWRPEWLAEYIRLEVLLLAELGYGLDFSQCAISGETDIARLAYVSPKTGRAVTAEAAGEYAPRCLPLPQFLVADAVPDLAALADGLRLTGHFLEPVLTELRALNLLPLRRHFVSIPKQQAA